MAHLYFYRWITLVSLFIWIIVYWQAGRKVFVDILAAANSKTSRVDLILIIVISLCSFMVMGVCLFGITNLLRIVFLQNSIFILIGMLLTLSGIIGMFACRHYLGKFWTAEINLAESHKIIDTGPYRIVRHPIYTFAILMYFGLGMAFLSPWTGLLIGLIVAAYFLKTKDEDAYLQKNLEGYREYASRVRYRLVPGLW